MSWFKRTPKPPPEPFEPATEAQIGSIQHNISIMDSDNPRQMAKLDQIGSLLNLRGDWQDKASFNHVSKQTATEVIRILRA